jgi:hypothetical protein
MSSVRIDFPEIEPKGNGCGFGRGRGQGCIP